MHVITTTKRLVIIVTFVDFMIEYTLVVLGARSIALFPDELVSRGSDPASISALTTLSNPVICTKQ